MLKSAFNCSCLRVRHSKLGHVCTPELRRLEGSSIRSERVSQHERVATVVFGSRHDLPVTEPLRLFRVDGENGDALLDQRINDRVIRGLDDDGPVVLGDLRKAPAASARDA